MIFKAIYYFKRIVTLHLPFKVYCLEYTTLLFERKTSISGNGKFDKITS